MILAMTADTEGGADHVAVAAKHDHHILRGGGMLKPVALTDGVATGTWSIRKGRVEPTWFGQHAAPDALALQAADIEHFLVSRTVNRTATAAPLKTSPEPRVS
jgi:hypothetical protein